MAKQNGLFKAKGTLDDVSFYKSQDGYLIRMKGGVSAERMATDPAFARTRENHAEFSRAGKGGKLLRNAFNVLLQNARDGRVVSRLFKEMMRVVKSDTTSPRGERNIVDGNLVLLKGFEFNIDGKLSQTLYAPYTTSINRISGALTVTIPPFVPLNQIMAPVDATHYQILCGGGAIDFESGNYQTGEQNSAILPLDNVSTTALTLTHTASAGTVLPLFLLLGIQFYQEVNGSQYPLRNGAFNALALVEVEMA